MKEKGETGDGRQVCTVWPEKGSVLRQGHNFYCAKFSGCSLKQLGDFLVLLVRILFLCPSSNVLCKPGVATHFPRFSKERKVRPIAISPNERPCE